MSNDLALDERGRATGTSWVQRTFEFTALAVALFFTIVLSLRNWKMGRVDRRGALRLAIGSSAVAWAATVVASAIFAAQSSAASNRADWLVSYFLYFVIFLAIIGLMLRLGVVVMIAMVYSFNCMNMLRVGADWAAWYLSS